MHSKGTGKTLAFGLSLVSQLMKNTDSIKHKHTKRPLRGLILAPSCKMANQFPVKIDTLLHDTNLNSYVVVGRKNINMQINKMKASRTDLLVATPGRLIDLMDQRYLSLAETSFFGIGQGRPHAGHELPPRSESSLASGSPFQELRVEPNFNCDSSGRQILGSKYMSKSQHDSGDSDNTTLSHA